MAPAADPTPSPARLNVTANQAFKLIGLGGVGSILVRYMSLLLASLDRSVRVVLIDGDQFDSAANRSRMFISEAANKAAVVRDDLLAALGDSQLTLSAVEEYITPDNIARLIHSGDTVLLAVDNHATRGLVSDFCSGRRGWPGLADVCLISGGNDGVGTDSTGVVRQGTYGNCQIYVRRAGQDLSVPLDEFHEEIADPADRSPAELSCQELLASTPQILPANLQTAAAMLSTLWLHLSGQLPYAELAFDIALARMRPLPFGLPEFTAPQQST
jgi:hypothetical protein